VNRATGVLAATLVYGAAWALTAKLRARRTIVSYPDIPKQIRRQGRLGRGRTKKPNR
jgi:hypothetical protein